MGSGCLTVAETVDYLNAQGRKVGAVFVRLFRPFCIKAFVERIPKTVKRVCVLDRVKEITASASPLKLDVIQALLETGRLQSMEKVIGGIYGLSSKDFIPADVVACFDNLELPEPVEHFTTSITDDVTHKSLPRKNLLTCVPEGTVQCIFYG